MKKLISITCILFAALYANAQLKVVTGGKVGIATSTPSSLLSVGGTGYTTWTIYGYNPVTTSSQGVIYATSPAATAGGNYYGITGATPNGSGNSYGVTGSASSTSAVSGTAMGVYGYGKNGGSGLTYGVYGYLDGSSNGAGVFGTTSGGATLEQKYAGYFKGAFETTDDSPQKPNAGSWSGGSDSRIKKDITDFKDGLSVIRKIRPVNYKFNGIGGYPTTKAYIGVIAQEVNQVAPYCIAKRKIIIKDSEKSNFASDIVGTIKNDTTGNKYIAEILSYNQDGLFYAMINSIKELDSTVTALQKQIGSQRTGNSSGKGNSETTLQVDLANKDNVILYQNQPNPFDGSTVIRFFIPENTNGTAFVAFYDMYGKVVNKIEIKEKGFGKIEANTENLAGGIYSYSIIVNDKVIDTKKMMKSK
jgi:hypothetical protein